MYTRTCCNNYFNAGSIEQAGPHEVRGHAAAERDGRRTEREGCAHQSARFCLRSGDPSLHHRRERSSRLLPGTLQRECTNQDVLGRCRHPLLCSCAPDLRHNPSVRMSPLVSRHACPGRRAPLHSDGASHTITRTRRNSTSATTGLLWRRPLPLKWAVRKPLLSTYAGSTSAQRMWDGHTTQVSYHIGL